MENWGPGVVLLLFWQEDWRWIQRAEMLLALTLGLGLGFTSLLVPGGGGLLRGTWLTGGLLKGNCGRKSIGRATIRKGWKL